jgi:hypothetical protein
MSNRSEMKSPGGTGALCLLHPSSFWVAAYSFSGRRHDLWLCRALAWAHGPLRRISRHHVTEVVKILVKIRLLSLGAICRASGFYPAVRRRSTNQPSKSWATASSGEILHSRFFTAGVTSDPAPLTRRSRRPGNRCVPSGWKIVSHRSFGSGLVAGSPELDR